MSMVATFKNKRELVDHIVREHPELVWPDRPTLNKIRSDELDRLHRDLHEPSPFATP